MPLLCQIIKVFHDTEIKYVTYYYDVKSLFNEVITVVIQGLLGFHLNFWSICSFPRPSECKIRLLI